MSEVCVIALVAGLWAASLLATAYLMVLSAINIITIGKLRVGVRLEIAEAELHEDVVAGIDTLRSLRFGAKAWRLIQRVRESQRG